MSNSNPYLVPEHNENGQNQGLIVQNVEIGGVR